MNIPVGVITSDGQVVAGDFTLWEEAPENPDQVRLDLHFAGETVSAVADTYFFALADIRKVLEARALRPRCLGASRDVYPSPMITSMGTGDLAFRLRLGCPAKMEDIVEIFTSNAEIIPTSVEEQEGFYRNWLESLKRKAVHPTRDEAR